MCRIDKILEGACCLVHITDITQVYCGVTTVTHTLYEHIPLYCLPKAQSLYLKYSDPVTTKSKMVLSPEMPVNLIKIPEMARNFLKIHTLLFFYKYNMN